MSDPYDVLLGFCTKHKEYFHAFVMGNDVMRNLVIKVGFISELDILHDIRDLYEECSLISLMLGVMIEETELLQRRHQI